MTTALTFRKNTNRLTTYMMQALYGLVQSIYRHRLREADINHSFQLVIDFLGIVRQGFTLLCISKTGLAALSRHNTGRMARIAGMAQQSIVFILGEVLAHLGAGLAVLPPVKHHHYQDQ